MLGNWVAHGESRLTFCCCSEKSYLKLGPENKVVLVAETVSREWWSSFSDRERDWEFPSEAPIGSFIFHWADPSLRLVPNYSPLGCRGNSHYTDGSRIRPRNGSPARIGLTERTISKKLKIKLMTYYYYLYIKRACERWLVPKTRVRVGFGDGWRGPVLGGPLVYVAGTFSK
jgi:hypothetical protein